VHQTYLGHNGNIRTLIKLYDFVIVRGSEDTLIKMWNIDSEVCFKTIQGHSSCVICLLLQNDTTF